MKCPKCGNNVSDGAKFCSKCGADLKGVPSSQNPPVSGGGKLPKQEKSQKREKPQKQEKPQKSDMPLKREKSLKREKPLEQENPPIRQKPQTQKKPPMQDEPQGKTKHSGIFIGLAVAVLLIGCAGGGYVGYQAYQRFTNQDASDSGWGSQDTDTKDMDKGEDSGQPGDSAETGGQTEETEGSLPDRSAESGEDADGSGLSAVGNPLETTAPSAADGLGGAGNDRSGTTAAWAANSQGETAAACGQGETAAAWAVNSTAGAASESGFIIPDSSTRYLSDADLAGLTSEQLRLARNEIYARHGRKFNDEGLQSYFDSQPWYSGTIEAERFSDDTYLNAFEKKNRDLIKAREAALN